VYYIFKDFPLSSIHPQAQRAAEAAECAGLQNAYWPMHDLLFARQGEWSGKGNLVDRLVGYAGELGLDTEAFRACVESGNFTAEVQADLQEGAQAGVRGTPTFFINGTPLVGAVPYENLRQAIEAALANP
jgi:protein-disulfide isomerase